MKCTKPVKNNPFHPGDIVKLIPWSIYTGTSHYIVNDESIAAQMKKFYGFKGISTTNLSNGNHCTHDPDNLIKVGRYDEMYGPKG